MLYFGEITSTNRKHGWLKYMNVLWLFKGAFNPLQH